MRPLLDAFPYVSAETGRLLEFVRERLDQLADVHRGREEWERDEWRVERLGIDTRDIRGPARLSFMSATSRGFAVRNLTSGEALIARGRA